VSAVIRAISAMDKEKTQPQQQPAVDGTAKNGSGASDQFQDEFYTTGRIGRRNAMPDILGNNCTASSGADLPLKLSALTTNGNYFCTVFIYLSLKQFLKKF
jgi:cAMP-dependent protein kinase inhibitor